MPEIVLLGLRIGLLVLLWLFVLIAIRAVRTDLFGASTRSPATAPVAPKTQPARSATPAPPRLGQPPADVRSLVVTSGPLAGTVVTLGDSPVIIGRAGDATLVLADDYTSSHHARLVPRDGAWWLEDTGSTNGTFVAAKRINGPVRLASGMRFRVGTTTLELRR